VPERVAADHGYGEAPVYKELEDPGVKKTPSPIAKAVTRLSIGTAHNKSCLLEALRLGADHAGTAQSAMPGPWRYRPR
jgi:hypothetical protein